MGVYLMTPGANESGNFDSSINLGSLYGDQNMRAFKDRSVAIHESVVMQVILDRTSTQKMESVSTCSQRLKWFWKLANEVWVAQTNSTDFQTR